MIFCNCIAGPNILPYNESYTLKDFRRCDLKCIDGQSLSLCLCCHVRALDLSMARYHLHLQVHEIQLSAFGHYWPVCLQELILLNITLVYDGPGTK